MYHRPVCQPKVYTLTTLQQSVLRGGFRGRGCSGSTGLGFREQLGEPTVLPAVQCSRHRQEAEGCGDCPRSPVACTTVVSSPSGHVGDASSPDPEQSPCSAAHGRVHSRTVQESAVATLRLEDIWRHDVMAQGWSSRAAAQLSFSLAPSTLLTYNRVLNKLKQFCLERGVPYPPVSSATVADFLCFLADDSARPRSVLVTAQAALGHLYTGLHLPNVIKCPVIVRLSDALVKSGTTSLMLPSRVMPTQDFKDLFCGWPDNDRLELQNLRLKAITLLALLLMLRPSDIAPRAELFDSATTTSHRVIFSTDQLVFNDDG